MSSKTKKTPDTSEAPQATIDHINTLLNEVKNVFYRQTLGEMPRGYAKDIGHT